tara:strand:- start:204 stop:515 length:312 start_codon:yes stop_codon:yes gene_type:complete
MSINISISNSQQSNCNDVIDKLLKSNINARVIETKSTVDGIIENGCLITLGKEYGDIKKIKKIWNNISSNYTCGHLKIDGIFDGCIFNYISKDLCPGSDEYLL